MGTYVVQFSTGFRENTQMKESPVDFIENTIQEAERCKVRGTFIFANKFLETSTFKHYVVYNACNLIASYIQCIH